MAQMQFLGTAPQKKSRVAEAMAGGVEGYMRGKERRETKKMELDKIDYGKKRDAANMVIAVAKTLDPDKADELINKEEVKALFGDLNWPLPTGLHVERDVKEAAIESVAKGEPLPGMTMDETKKAAGVFISPTKISGADVKAFKGEVPWYEKFWPGAQTAAGKKYKEMEKRRMEQFSGRGISGGAGHDPLGAR